MRPITFRPPGFFRDLFCESLGKYFDQIPVAQQEALREALHALADTVIQALDTVDLDPAYDRASVHWLALGLAGLTLEQRWYAEAPPASPRQRPSPGFLHPGPPP